MTDHIGCSFDSNANKYKCCCNAIDVKTGAQIVAFVSIVQLGLLLVEKVVFTANGYLSYEIAQLVLWGLAVICLFYAFRTERPIFCAPYILATLLQVIFGVLSIILSIVAICDNTSFASEYVLVMTGEYGADSEMDVTKAAIKLICWTITMDIIMASFFVWIIYKYYAFLRDQMLSKKNIATVRYTTRTLATPDNNLTTIC